MAELKDAYGRILNYVRISLTDRCNFRCSYCMPEEGVKCISHDEIMRYEEVLYLCSVFSELGVQKIRFTGGEPMVRKGLIPFLASVRHKMPDMKIALTTNASLLDTYASSLSSIGLSSLNISLDTLCPEKFKQITRLGELSSVLSGIKAAKAAKIDKIKINTVLIRGFNDMDISELIEFAKTEGHILRFIEFMPLDDSIWSKNSYISAEEIVKILENKGYIPLNESKTSSDGPALYYIHETEHNVVGVIAAVSNHFCADCNRLRVSPSGSLRTCLFSPVEIPLRQLIARQDTKALKELILENALKKPRCWDDVRNGHLNMSKIGG